MYDVYRFHMICLNNVFYVFNFMCYGPNHFPKLLEKSSDLNEIKKKYPDVKIVPADDFIAKFKLENLE